MNRGIRCNTRRILGLLVAGGMVLPLAGEQVVLQRRVVAGDLIFNGPADGNFIVIDDFGGWGGPGFSGEEPRGPRTDGFQIASGGVAIEDTAAADAIKHFRDKDWFKAIAAIEELGQSNDTRLVTDPSGVLRPVSSMRRALLDALPEEGRQTFRMLNSPAAQTKLAEARKSQTLEERALKLEEVLSAYGLCDAAVGAASDLGDIRFEAGRFDEAADLYARAAEHPGSTTDDPRLMCKRLHALARAGKWAAFDTLAQYAAFRHPQAGVELGGKRVSFAQITQSLSALRNATPDQPNPGSSRPLTLTPDQSPAFSVKLIDDKLDHTLRLVAMQNQIGGIAEQQLHPSVIAGPGRYYTLHLDTVTALDAQTGSELWHSGDPQQSTAQITQNIHYLRMDYQQSLILHRDLLLVTNSDPQAMNWSRLRVIDSKTGEEKWNSKSIGATAHLSFVGRPLAEDGTVFCTVRESAGNQLKLVGMNLADGGSSWMVDLGTAPPDPNWNQPIDVCPRIVKGERYLLVLTNNGAVIAVDPDTQAIAWAYAYPILPSDRQRRTMHDVPTPGEIFAHNGIIFSKDTRDDTLHAIREYDAARLWSLPVSREDTIVHIDNRHIYLLGDQLTALDIKTGKPVWWSPHAGESAAPPVFSSHDCIIMGSNRTCRIDLTTGKVTTYRNDLAMDNHAGALLQNENMLGFATRDWLRVYRMPDRPTSGDLTP